MAPKLTICDMLGLKLHRFARRFFDGEEGVEASDMARLCGACVDEDNGKTAIWCTNDDAGGNEYDWGTAQALGCYGIKCYLPTNLRDVAVCPVSTSSEISEAPRTGVSGMGWYEVVCGEYPQTAAPNQNEIEEAFKTGKAKKTGRTFTTDSRSIDFDPEHDPIYSSEQFKPRTLKEVELNGKTYVRVESLCDTVLSNSASVKKGEAIWVEVEPVKWAVDERQGAAITTKAIISGVQYKDCLENGDWTRYNGNFEKTRLNWFLQNHLAKDIFAGLEDKKEKDCCS